MTVKTKTKPTPIPLFNVKASYLSLRTELRRAALKVLDSGSYILGPELRAFEEELAEFVGCRFAAGVSSGTTALETALRAVGVGPGDEVIVPAFTFMATASAVSIAGAKPRFVDVDLETMNISVDALVAAIRSNTKAVIPVHLYGRPAEMSPIMDVARSRGLKVIEDCAQAQGAVYQGRQVGSIGDAGAFSFYPSKNLGGLGDGGALTTGDEGMRDAFLELRHMGNSLTERNRHVRLGSNARLNDMEASLLRIKLRRVKEWVERRRRIAASYLEGLKGLPLALPDPGRNGTLHSFGLFVVRAEERDRLARHLSEAGVSTGVYYPIALPLQPAYRFLEHNPGDFPAAEEAARTVLALPMFPEISGSEIRRIVTAVRSFFGK